MKLTKIISLLIVLCLAVCLCACGGDVESSSTAESSSASDSSLDASSDASSEASSEVSEAAAFTVTVVDTEGNPVSGVRLQICKESCFPAKSDENGLAKFSVEITDGYKLSVTACPAGYAYNGEAEVYLEDGATEYTVTLDAVAENE